MGEKNNGSMISPDQEKSSLNNASETVNLSHGSGGKAMRDLVARIFVEKFKNPLLVPLEDQARVDLGDLTKRGDRLAFTTDTYVVDPLFFPGGDIGTLAVNGTVNDLAVGGAVPLYLSCGMILEEGLPVETLEQVTDSMRMAAQAAKVLIVTGDTKVVPRGKVDKLFINTAGIGVIPKGVNPSADRAQSGDAILINGTLGDHGAAILNARGDLALDAPIKSDCQPLHTLVQSMLAVCPDLHCMRDATRGGLATVLNEFAESSGCALWLDENALPIREEIRGVCEILGLDPLYLANEGKLVVVVPKDSADPVLQAMREHPLGKESQVIGTVRDKPEKTVVLKTFFGGERVVDMLTGEQLPRIC